MHLTTALISHTSKILLSVLLSKKRNVIEKQIVDVQMGFRKGDGTRDQIFNLHSTQYTMLSYSKVSYFWPKV